MLQLLGTARRCCDGLTRRGALQAGSLAAMGGFGLPQYLQAEEAGLLRNGPAKNVIVLYLPGGAATQDMVDLKPHAPAEVRGEFKPISTNVPGIQICEHLPRMAQWAHRLAIVRSVDHKAGCDHWTFCYSSMLAGAGIRGGTVYGSSDSQAAYPAENLVRPADLCMTVLDRPGISPELRLPDRAGRPMDISFGGRPITEILTG